MVERRKRFAGQHKRALYSRYKMKREAVLKKLKRYEKSLAFMEKESMESNERADAEHYRNDRIAFNEAIKLIESGRSNT